MTVRSLFIALLITNVSPFAFADDKDSVISAKCYSAKTASFFSWAWYQAKGRAVYLAEIPSSWVNQLTQRAYHPYNSSSDDVPSKTEVPGAALASYMLEHQEVAKRLNDWGCTKVAVKEVPLTPEQSKQIQSYTIPKMPFPN